ncbi:MAG: OB-fold nucleic acid binding domain-containing protein, partial [Flavobacteriales bacterium]|nr:OB-fold nucleic acid binding domain-containing protein [Flavobacteriales bacterium]
MFRTHTCGELSAKNIGEKVTLSGWVQHSRDLGQMVFIDLRDRYGITQLTFNEKSAKGLLEKAKTLGREYVIQATGHVIERASKNPNNPTGEIELFVDELNILNTSEVPPFTIEDVSDGGEDIRMRYRYLDIRRNPVKENLLFRAKVNMEVRKYLAAAGFIDIETPYLINSTPEGARDFVVP